MKKMIQRKDVSKLLVSDDYFSEKHYLLKILQTLVAIIGWMGVILPFVWLSIPFVFPKFAEEYSFRTYAEGFQTFRFLLIFLTISFVFILIFYICMTIWNNYRFSHFLQKEPLFNEKRLEKRKKLINEAYDERFCPEEIRHNVKFYSVSEEQNLDKEFFRKMYKDNEVPL